MAEDYPSSYSDVPQTPRGQSNKRLPTTPVDDGDYANGYLADYERDLPRVGSASKRLRGSDNVVSILLLVKDRDVLIESGIRPDNGYAVAIRYPLVVIR